MAEAELGKARRLAMLADWDGHVQILAADSDDPGAAEVAIGLSGQASGVVITPTGWAEVAAGLDRGCAGLLRPDPDDDPATAPLAALRAGATALAWRLTCPVKPQAAELARLAGLAEECTKQGLPLVVLLGLPADDSPEAARSRPALVRDSVAALAAAEVAIDLLAIPCPADLRYTTEYAAGALDGESRPALAPLATVTTDLAAVAAASPAPWLLLAEGEPEVWLTALRLAMAHGALGFAADRTTWSAIPSADRPAWLVGDGLQSWRRAIALTAVSRG